MNHKHSKTNNQPRTTDYKLLTTKKELRKIHSFIQNKPNLPNARINVSIFMTRDYENARLHRSPKRTQNEPNSNPIYEMPKMNVNKILTKSCEIYAFTDAKKTNPKQTQFRSNIVQYLSNFFLYSVQMRIKLQLCP